MSRYVLGVGSQNVDIGGEDGDLGVAQWEVAKGLAGGVGGDFNLWDRTATRQEAADQCGCE